MDKKRSEEINAEIRAERNRECQEGVFDSWKADSLRQLKDDFCEENEEDFNNFCKEEFKLWRDS